MDPLQSIFLSREMFQLEEVKWLWLDSISFGRVFLKRKISSAKASVVISRFDIEMNRGFWKKNDRNSRKVRTSGSPVNAVM